MKTILALIPLLALAMCTPEPKDVSLLSVLADRTDTIIPVPSIGDVELLFNRNHSANAGAKFRFQNIGNTDVNPTYQTELSSYSALGNKLMRQAEVKQFYADIDTLLLIENDRDYRYYSSSVFVPLLDELKYVRDSDATSKTVALYSDLGEISDLFSVISYEGRKMVLKNPEAVAEHFKQILEIPDLTGVTLYVSFLPQTNDQNRMFRGMCKVLEETFKESGLEIQIGIDKTLASWEGSQ